MTTFVLVHGAWGGSYGWTDFARLMRSAGHEVYTPSLTGQGERSHLGGPDVNLTTHILDVENCIKYEDLHDFVLVGHSYGGMVVTGVADRIPELITDLIYVDAFLPKDGESCFDLGGAGGAQQAVVEDGWKVMPMARRTGIPETPGTPEMKARRAKMSPQPIGTLLEKVRLSVPLEERRFSLTYIKAAGDLPGDANRTGAFWDASERTKNDPRWRYFELPCGHGVHSEMPNELKAILEEVTSRQPVR
jgi:pimeloyl-ACP methyl ester carboxylesterase